MSKLKNINEELIKKVLAGSTAFVLTFSGVPKIVNAANSNYCTQNSSVSSNACYDEKIGEFEINGEIYTLKRMANDSLIAESKNDDTENKISIKKDGTVDISTTKKTILGFKNTINESFKIKKFTGDSIEIDKSTIKNNDIKSSVIAFENYINEIKFNDKNYIKETEENPTKENIEKANQQVFASFYQMSKDLKKNDINIEHVQNIQMNSLAPTLPLSPTLSSSEYEKMTTLTEEASEKLKTSLSKLKGKSLPVLLLVGTAYLIIYINATYTPPLTYDEVYGTAIAKGLSLDEVDLQSFTEFRDWSKVGGYVPVALAMPTIYRNLTDKNPNNDYFIACINDFDHNIYINVLRPLSIDYAAKYLKVGYILDQLAGPNDRQTMPDPFNIYTYFAERAKEVIVKAGGIPGTSKKDPSGKFMPECHAFENSYQLFDNNTKTVKLKNFKLDKKVQPGFYYWHYHYYGKKLYDPIEDKNKDNGKHSFFGLPIYISKNDIKKYESKSISDAKKLDSNLDLTMPNKYADLLEKNKAKLLTK